MRLFRAVAIAAVFALAACGTTTDDNNPSNGNPDAGDNNNNGDKAGLVINAALGFNIVDSPLDGEGPASALITVSLDGNDAPEGTTLSVNGVAMSNWLGAPNIFELAEGTSVSLAAGGKITLEAHSGAKSSTLVLDCPSDPSMSTSPSAGASIGEGDHVTVSWTGDAYYNPDLGSMFGPDIRIYPYDSATNKTSGFPQGDQNVTPTPPATSVQVVAGGPGETGYLVQLDVPGKFTYAPNPDGGRNVGYCGLTRRAKFQKR